MLKGYTTILYTPGSLATRKKKATQPPTRTSRQTTRDDYMSAGSAMRAGLVTRAQMICGSDASLLLTMLANPTEYTAITTQ